MYSELFSRIYHDFGWNYYPEVFAGTLLKWIRQQGICVRSLLDLGCGTGVLCKRMREAGIDAVGVDLSESMIRIAREEDPAGSYEVADMTAYVPERTFDLATCTGDAINHLPSMDAIARTFSNIYAGLREGGYLIFDLLNEKEIAKDEPFDYDFSERVKARFHMYRTDADTVCLEVKEWEDGKLRMTEVITERIYPVEKIGELLENAGFHQVTVSHRLLEGEGNEAITWYVTACKA